MYSNMVVAMNRISKAVEICEEIENEYNRLQEKLLDGQILDEKDKALYQFCDHLMRMM